MIKELFVPDVPNEFYVNTPTSQPTIDKPIPAHKLVFVPENEEKFDEKKTNKTKQQPAHKLVFVPDSKKEKFSSNTKIDQYQEKENHEIIMAVFSCFFVIMVSFFIYIYYVKPDYFQKTSKYFNSSFSIAFVVSLLVWQIVTSFITNIMNPLVQASIPEYNWKKEIVLRSYKVEGGTINVVMDPGDFVLTFISFFIIIILLFIIVEISRGVINYLSIHHFINYFIYFVFTGLVLGIVIWNAVVYNENENEISNKIQNPL